MNAPVNEQVKAEAAKSLLERMAEKTKLVRFFRYNASAKHGVPIDSEKDITITPETPQEPAQEPQAAQNIVQIVKTDDCEEKTARERELELELELLRQSQNSGNGQPPQNTGTADGAGQNNGQSPGMSDKIKGILQTLAVLGGLGAAGYVGSQIVGSDDNPQDNVKVTAPYYSPYQYLEDSGEHLP